jgi:hypothetical protein
VRNFATDFVLCYWGSAGEVASDGGTFIIIVIIVLNVINEIFRGKCE